MEHDLADLDVVKVTINAFDPDRLPAILAASGAMGVTVELSSSPLFVGVPVVNVTAAGVTKGTSVAWAARRMGTASQDVLVVGDGFNDVSMFQVAGTAIAMGDAPEAVKAATHLVTASREQDGLAVALHPWINHGPPIVG
ncbi:MAG: HAD hydrolase family protein [Actinomycetota bacterium]|nr:HAD hydrolase family protein [Actinomycetota bacterium]